MSLCCIAYSSLLCQHSTTCHHELPCIACYCISDSLRNTFCFHAFKSQHVCIFEVHEGCLHTSDKGNQAGPACVQAATVSAVFAKICNSFNSCTVTTGLSGVCQQRQTLQTMSRGKFCFVRKLQQIGTQLVVLANLCLFFTRLPSDKGDEPRPAFVLTATYNVIHVLPMVLASNYQNMQFLHTLIFQ